MPDTLPTHPMQDAVVDLMRAFDGIHGTLASVDANRPGKDATEAEQVAFLDALYPLITEAQLSIALVSGALAHHLRQRRGPLN